MLNCYLHRSQRDKHTLPFRTNLQTHAYDELTYFISGKGTTQIHDTVFPYRAKTFAFYRAGTVHDENDPVPCDVIWSHFKLNIEGLSLKEGVFEDPHGELLALLQKLRRLSEEHSPYRDILLDSCLAEVAVTAVRLQTRVPQERIATDWQGVLNYIDENSNTEIDFHALAARCHYSYDRFRHLFREKFGVAPHAYLLQKRLGHASYMLTNSAASLTDIAYDCGFSGSSEFSNLFKKYHGMTPKEYRKEIQKTGTTER